MKLLYISLILGLIIIASLIINYVINHMKRESFANIPIIITDNLLNIKMSGKNILEDYFVISSKNHATIIDNIKKSNIIDKKTLGIDELPKNAIIELLIDPYINYYILNNNAENSRYKEGIFVCISNNVIRKDDCIWDLHGKVVGYIYMSDYLFVQALIKGYNLDIDSIYLKKIKLEDLNTTNKRFDYLFTYMVLNSEYMNYICNLSYYINGLKDVDIHRIKAYYPFIEENYNTIKYYYSKSKEIENDGELGESIKSDDIYLSSENSLFPIMRYNIISSVENFITRLEMPADYLEAVKESYDKSDKGGFYGCYGNGEITSKFECDSYYNIDGTPKQYYSLWDKRCEADIECPYYKSNSNYINNRGGCINGGFCEFPVGVKRLGFTKYTDTNLNKPLCYNCEDDVNGGIPKKPDYVFENDFEERKNNNLNTIISLLDYRSFENNEY